MKTMRVESIRNAIHIIHFEITTFLIFINLN